MKSRREGKSGIRLYEQKSRETSGEFDRISLFAARTMSAGFLAVAWLENFLSVFPMQVQKARLYILLFLLSGVLIWMLGSRGKKKFLYLAADGVVLIFLAWKNQLIVTAVLNSIANAYLRVHQEGTVPLLLYEVPELSVSLLAMGFAVAMIPFLAVFSLALLHGKGEIAVVLLLLIPAILSAMEGYFPSVNACGLLVLACGIYFAIGSGSSGKSVWGNAAAAAVLLSVLCAVSWGFAGRIEAGKTVENGPYVQAQAAIEKHVVQKLKEITGTAGDKEENQEEPEERKEEQPEEAQDLPPETADQNSEDMQGGIFPEEGGSPGIGHDRFTGGGTASLQNIGYFQPGDGEGITVGTDTRPETTFYLPLEFGGTYENSTWSTLENHDEVLDQYKEYPENLTRLISLCKKQDIQSVEDASDFIQKEFEENTVYDYNPGTTPQDQDFAEYFLFENKKGFCVHFATTAVLMYRIMGFTARYAEGYAIPPSAFIEQEDGTYRAEVTGDMGHAWCETYENAWVVREHTLPYTGNSQSSVPPASSSPASVHRLSKTAVTILKVFLLIVLCIIITAVQAAVRRKNKSYALSRYAEGRGIVEIYLAFCRMAGLLGVSAETPFSAASFEALRKALPQVSGQDWEMLRQAALKAAYDKAPPSKEIHDKLFLLYKKTSKAVHKELPFMKKIQYHFIKCLP